MNKIDKLFVIIATYNGETWIERCLKSIPDHYEVIVVDNNSSDTTLDYIETKFPSITLIKQTKNLGFGAANNIGISHALKQEAGYVFLLNQDAYLQTNTIETLINIHKENKEYGVLSPIHLNGSSDRLDFNFSNYVIKNKKFLFDAVNQKYSKRIYEVPFVNAAAWLIPSSTFVSIGGFDSIFFHYGEDDNFCQRVLFHQLKIGIAPGVFVLHDREFRGNSNELTNKEQLLLKERMFKNKWANVNVEIDSLIIKQKRKLIRIFIKLVFQLKFEKAFLIYKELKSISKMTPLIHKSRLLNKTPGCHYLDF
jgi:GT2 family glycosyltransferase